MNEARMVEGGSGLAVALHGSLRYATGLLMLLLLAAPAKAQEDAGACDPPTDKKVLKLLEDAGKAKDANARHQKLKAAVDADPDCAECLLRAGISAYRIAREANRDMAPALRYLEQLHARCPEYHSDLPYHMGMIQARMGEHADALASFEAFRKFPADDAKRMSKDYDRKAGEVDSYLPELRFMADFYSNKAPFDPTPVPNVNTKADEYLPMLSPDNELLFFTRVGKHQPKGYVTAVDVEEFIESRRGKDDGFDAGKPLPDPFNQGDSYGGVTISVNNKEMYVTVCTATDQRGYRNCDLFRTHYDVRFDLDAGGPVYEWTELRSLGPDINSPNGWESQPTLSADGRTLYFAANRADSRGMDIFQSLRDENGNWGAAEPVPGINTDGDEKAPFLHSDSRTLYFAARPPVDEQGRPDVTRGHRGAGGWDIFYSRMDDDGRWGTPRNIGHPINTADDEHGLIVSADGRTAYFASNRYRGAGGLDILHFDLPRAARPEDILVVKGEVRDEQGRLVTDAVVEVKYMDTRRTEVISVDGTDGRYATVVRLKEGDDVVLTVKKKDHVFDTRAFSAADTVRGGTAEVDMTVQKIAVGKSYKVNDIRYATNSAAITDASQYILDELIGFLRENPTVKIRIEGHTDNVGRLEDNMVLSNDRANTVMRYLVDKGIKPARLSAKGLGPTKPEATNDTADGRALNRRTEFVIVGR